MPHSLPGRACRTDASVDHIRETASAAGIVCSDIRDHRDHRVAVACRRSDAERLRRLLGGA